MRADPICHGGAWLFLILFSFTILAPAIHFGIPAALDTNRVVLANTDEKTQTALSPDSAEQEFVHDTNTLVTTPPYFNLGLEARSQSNSLAVIEEFEKKDGRIMGRYAEHSYNLDQDMLDEELHRQMAATRRTSYVSLKVDECRRDLMDPSSETNTLDTVMQDVIRNLEAQNTPTPRQEPEGYLTAIVYLLMVVIVLLVAIARK